jgi:hypothetical protein
MFRFEFSDNLKLRHLSKIESIPTEPETQARRADRGQRILNTAGMACSRKPKFHHARQIGAREHAQSPQRRAQRPRFSVHLSGSPIRFSDK